MVVVRPRIGKRTTTIPDHPKGKNKASKIEETRATREEVVMEETVAVAEVEAPASRSIACIMRKT